jgi:hypothetical protein
MRDSPGGSELTYRRGISEEMMNAGGFFLLEILDILIDRRACQYGSLASLVI